MSLSQEEVSKAVHAGLSILGPDSDVTVPANLVGGLHHLKQLLHAIGDGTYALVPTMQMKPPEKKDDDDS